MVNSQVNPRQLSIDYFKTLDSLPNLVRYFKKLVSLPNLVRCLLLLLGLLSIQMQCCAMFTSCTLMFQNRHYYSRCFKNL